MDVEVEQDSGPQSDDMNDGNCLATRLARLEAEHRALDGQIINLQSQVYQDQLQLQRMKKRKLALKDRIARLEDRLLPDIIA